MTSASPRCCDDAHNAAEPGLRVLGHRRVFAARIDGGLTWPITFPITWDPINISWLDIGELPDLDGRQAALRPAYEQHLQGEAVMDTLERALLWFGRAAAMGGE